MRPSTKNMMIICLLSFILSILLASNSHADIFDNLTNTTNSSLNITINQTNETNQTNQTNLTLNVDYDSDNDTYNSSQYAGTDCDDNDSSINPGKKEALYNNKDDDCNEETNDYLLLEITTTKERYALGEAVSFTVYGINASNLSLRIKNPQNNYPYALDYNNATYPITENFQQTYKNGTYRIYANITYFEKETNLTHKLNITQTFEVANSITAIINAPSQSVINEAITLKTTGAGGVGALSYTWNFGDNSQNITGLEVTHNYTKSGTYTIRLIAKDEKNNTNEFTDTIQIHDYYKLLFQINDKEKSLPLSDAVITINAETKNTNPNGQTEFILKPGEIEFSITKTNYQTLSGSFDLDRNDTINLTLSQTDTTPPIISLANKEALINGNNQTTISYILDDASKTTCTFYISEDGNWWTEKNKTYNITTKDAITVSLENLIFSSYYYKIECLDTKGNKAYSEQGTITNNQQAFVVTETNAYADLITAIELSLEAYDYLTPEQKRLLDELDSKTKIKEVQRFIQNYDRDVDSIKNPICPGAYCKLSEEEKNEKINELTMRIDDYSSKTPIAVEIVSSEEYIKYPKLEEIQKIITMYYGAKKIVKEKSELEKISKETLKLQQQLDVKTKITLAKVIYLNIEEKRLLIVTKEINGNITEQNAFILEHIETTANPSISFSVETKPLNNSLYEIETSVLKNKLVYVISGKDLNPEITKNSQTLLFNPMISTKSSLIGYAILDGVDIKSALPAFIIITLIVVIVLRFTFSIAPGLNPFNSIFSSNKRRIKKISALINDAEKCLEQTEFEKASLIYKEIKLVYSSQNDRIREAVYDSIVILVKKMDDEYMKVLLKECERSIIEKNYDKASAIYQNISQVYEKLSDESKNNNYELIDILAKKMNKTQEAVHA